MQLSHKNFSPNYILLVVSRVENDIVFFFFFLMVIYHKSFVWYPLYPAVPFEMTCSDSSSRGIHCSLHNNIESTIWRRANVPQRVYHYDCGRSRFSWEIVYNARERMCGLLCEPQVCAAIAERLDVPHAVEKCRSDSTTMLDIYQ